MFYAVGKLVRKVVVTIKIQFEYNLLENKWLFIKGE